MYVKQYVIFHDQFINMIFQRSEHNLTYAYMRLLCKHAFHQIRQHLIGYNCNSTIDVLCQWI